MGGPDRGRPRRGPLSHLAIALAAGGWMAAWAPAVGAADVPPFEITAETIEYDATEKLYVGEGEVVIFQERTGRRLEADFVVFSRVTGRGAASGDVLIEDDDEQVEAELAVFEVDTLRAMVFEGSLRSDQRDGTGLRLRARELARVGDDSYEAWRAVFTTCRCPDEDARVPWRLRSSRAEVEIGGYGEARNVTFDVLGVPVVWLPWLLFPVKTERESGLLFPEFAFGSRNGFEIAQPVFLALGDPVNLTLTPRWLSDRGVRGEVGLETVWGRSSYLNARGTFLYDQQVLSDRDDVRDNNKGFDPGDPTSPRLKADEPLRPERWSLEIDGRTRAPGDIDLVADVTWLSDNDQPNDFNDLARFRRDRFVESAAFGSRHFGPSGALGVSGGVLWADDLQSAEDVDRDDFLLQRWPSVEARALPTPSPFARAGLVTSLGSEFVHFRAVNNPADQIPADGGVVGDTFFDVGVDALANSREGNNKKLANNGQPTAADPSGDDVGSPTPRTPVPTQGDGRFQDGEPLVDEGLRWSVQPRIARPTRLPAGLLLTPELAYRQVFTATDRQQHEERGHWTARLDLSTRLTRSFGRPDGQGRWVHWMEPSLSYLFAEPRGQTGDPLFVPPTRQPQARIRQLELDNLVSDPADRLEEESLFVLRVANRLYGRGARGRRRLVAHGTLSAAADLERDRIGLLIAEAGTGWPRGVRTNGILSFDPQDAEIDEAVLAFNTRLGSWGSLLFGYRYLREIPLFFESFRGDRFNRANEDLDQVNQVTIGTRVRLFERLLLGGRFTYSIEQDLALRSSASVDYVSQCKCWAAGVVASDNRQQGFQFAVRFTFLGPGFDPENPFSGRNPFALSAGLPGGGGGGG